jgi:hypothetical protein
MTGFRPLHARRPAMAATLRDDGVVMRRTVRSHGLETIELLATARLVGFVLASGARRVHLAEVERAAHGR